MTNSTPRMPLIVASSLVLALVLTSTLPTAALADPPLRVDGLVASIDSHVGSYTISVDTSYGTGPYLQAAYYITPDSLVVGDELEVGKVVRLLYHLDTEGLRIVDLAVVEGRCYGCN